MVCWGEYNEKPKNIVKEDIHLVNLAMYALGGTSLLFTIDGILKKELNKNDKILSETIGADNILIMSENAQDGTFTTKEYEATEKVLNHYAYKNTDNFINFGNYI
nr:MAG TPA: hypothetical protein [Caudoviricetes sp.]